MNENEDLMKQITTALEAAPAVRVPSDFAARVMSRVPQQQQRRIVVPAIPRARYGQLATFLSMFLLVGAMIALAPQTRSSLTWQILQAMLFGELGVLVLWFGWLRRTR